jgi:hypothetical protein
MDSPQVTNTTGASQPHTHGTQLGSEVGGLTGPSDREVEHRHLDGARRRPVGPAGLPRRPAIGSNHRTTGPWDSLMPDDCHFPACLLFQQLKRGLLLSEVVAGVRSVPRYAGLCMR